MLNILSNYTFTRMYHYIPPIYAKPYRKRKISVKTNSTCRFTVNYSMKLTILRNNFIQCQRVF